MIQTFKMKDEHEIMKLFFIILNVPSLEQIKQYFLESESPILFRSFS